MIIELEQGTLPWNNWRKLGTGASESAALFGESPYFTKRELWLTKKGIIPEWFIEQDNDYIFEKGHQFEEKMRAEYFAMTGENFLPVCVSNPLLPFIAASLDGRFGRKNFEAKLVSTEVKDEIARTGKAPRHHWIQMQHQFLADDGADVCIYFAHDLAGEAVVLEVLPDLDFMQTLEAELCAFNESLKNNQEPPMTEEDFHFSDNTSEFEELARLAAIKDEQETKLDEADKAYKLKMEEIVASSPHHHVASIDMAIKIKTMKRAGSIKYTEIPEVKALSSTYLEAFRGATSVFIQAWIKKPKAAK